jgi:amidase
MADSKRPLWQWSACELADAITARTVTAVEAVGSAVARMRATNGTINAVVDDLGDAALREAEAHDRAMRAGGPIGPLHGEPVTIKENVDQKGCATPNGVVAFKNVTGDGRALPLRRCQGAGRSSPGTATSRAPRACARCSAARSTAMP